MQIEFLMSCGHFQIEDVADLKYLNIDKRYNAAQGLCHECWEKLRKQHERARRRISHRMED